MLRSWGGGVMVFPWPGRGGGVVVFPWFWGGQLYPWEYLDPGTWLNPPPSALLKEDSGSYTIRLRCVFQDCTSNINNLVCRNLVFESISKLRYVNNYIQFRFRNFISPLRRTILLIVEIDGANVQLQNVKMCLVFNRNYVFVTQYVLNCF